MTSSFCVTGSSEAPPSVKAGTFDIAISIGTIAIILRWGEAIALADSIQALARKTGNLPESLSTPTASQG